MARLVFSIILILALSSCATLNAVLQPAPAPDSGFLQEQASTLAPQPERYPFARVWEDSEFRGTARPTLEVYVAPVDTAHVVNTSWWRRDRAAAQEAVREDAAKLADYMRNSFTNSLQQSRCGRVKLVEQPGPETAVLELAITQLRPTEVARAVVSNAASAFVPGASLLGAGIQGSIAVEGRLRRSRDGKLLFAFADRRKGKLAPLSLNDFTLYSHAREIIDEWAEQWAALAESAPDTAIAAGWRITLLPI